MCEKDGKGEKFMPILEVEFEVYCDRCGAGLCAKTRVSQRKKVHELYVEPCEGCLQEELISVRAEAFEEGVIQGRMDVE